MHGQLRILANPIAGFAVSDSKAGIVVAVLVIGFDYMFSAQDSC
jgi:hypothetical protein